MNYGKKAITKKRNSLTSASNMLGQKAHVSFLRLLFIALITMCVVITCLAFGSINGVIDNSPDVKSIDISPLGYATYLYDKDGNKMQKLAAPNANRQPVSLSQIPVDLQHAVVAIEDERFYEHNGIDVKGILRAFVKNITAGNLSEGASTITQQLLKNNVFTTWTSESTALERFTRKLQEQYLAVQVEQYYDKDVILENYLNTINLGAGAYGVQAAAQTYFNKDVSDLTLSECATIAGITQNPTRYNPINNPKENAQRRTEVLDHMLDQGYITQAQYDEAINDDVYTRIQAAQLETEGDTDRVYSYFVDELTDQVINDLMSIKGYTKTQASNLLYSGGLSIYTTQDPQIQNILDEEYTDESNFPAGTEYLLEWALTVTKPDGTQQNYSREMMRLYFLDQGEEFDDFLFTTTEEAQSYIDRYKQYVLSDGSTIVAESENFTPQPQSSMTVIDQSTGYVVALVGGRGEKTASLTLNRATDTTRQPGSTFKILSTYAPALNEKGMTLATTFEDEEYAYPDGTPVNNASMSYSGETTIRNAIINSINVVAVKCLEEVTPALGLSYLDSFGFTTLAHGTEADTDADGNIYTDENLPLALGGITNGVTNIELCAAYATIANGGNYIKPIYYTKIVDRNGNTIIENDSVSRSVIKESTAFLLTSAMEDVVSKGTGTLCQLDNMAVAGKTGTTEDYNDLWFAGYTPYYTCTVWSGYDNNKVMNEDERNFHKQLWQKVMNRIDSTKGLAYKDFSMPSSVTKTSICAETGLLPSVGCDVITEYFEISNLPTEYCEGHYDEEELEEETDELSDTITGVTTQSESSQYDENGNYIGDTSTDESYSDWDVSYEENY